MDRPDYLRPEAPPPPRKSLMPIALVALVASVLAAVLTVLTLGYFGPVLFIGLGVFAIIGLQYLLWGWWFERIYRNRPPEDDL